MLEGWYYKNNYCPITEVASEVDKASTLEYMKPTAYIHPNDLPSTSKNPPLPSRFKILDKGCGEYEIQNAFHVGTLPLSPKSHGRPNINKKTESASYQVGSTIFIQSSFLENEKIESSNDSWFYDDGLASFFQSEEYPIANKMCQIMNYKGKGLALHEQGFCEPLDIHEN